MEITQGWTGDPTPLIHVFKDSFTTSEGRDAGRMIADLVQDMLGTVGKDDLYVFSCHDGDDTIGAILFSRMIYADDPRDVFILSPVAVKPSAQRRGVGQALIRHGLDQLRADHVDVALTYGDPRYYTRFGFEVISETMAKAPQRLNFPHGWMGQSLDGASLRGLKGAGQCVDSLNKAEFW